MVLAVLAWTGGTLDFGFGWDPRHIATGLTRALFAFGLGVAIQRRFRGANRGLPWWLPVAVLAAFLALPGRCEWIVARDLFFAFAVVPALLVVGMGVEPPPAWAKVCATLGAMSYALYILHVPATILAEAAVRKLGMDPAATSVWVGPFWLGALVWGAIWLESAVERPLRQKLSRALKGHRV